VYLFKNVYKKGETNAVFVAQLLISHGIPFFPSIVSAVCTETFDFHFSTLHRFVRTKSSCARMDAFQIRIYKIWKFRVEGLVLWFSSHAFMGSKIV